MVTECKIRRDEGLSGGVRRLLNSGDPAARGADEEVYRIFRR